MNDKLKAKLGKAINAILIGICILIYLLILIGALLSASTGKPMGILAVLVIIGYSLYVFKYYYLEE